MSDDRPYGQQPGADETQPYSWHPGPGASSPPPPAYGPPAPYAAPPPYAVPAPYAPFGVDPASGLPWSDKSRVTAGLLSLLLPLVGVCGVGRLYAGNVTLGLLQLLGFWFGVVAVVLLIGLLVAPAVWLWAVVDGIVLLSSGGRDGTGRPLRP